ncbi:MAG: hypothetical protein HKM94_11340, partial [Halobacteria archaeon]|nr:hypothetical protein [Halobacteria archaeon]
LKLLETLLSRAGVNQGPQRDWLAGLFALFDIQGEKAGCPIAAVTAAYDGLDAQDGWWLRADPVYLQPDRSQAVLVASDALQLQVDESAALIETLNQHFATDGWHFSAPHPQRWYLRLDATDAIKTTPITEVMGQSVHPHLPHGDNQGEWHSRLNELQMLLHNHAVNAQRAEAGVIPVNSVWFWGEGQMPVSHSVPWDHVYSDDDVVRALAQLTNVECSPLAGFDPDSLQGRNLLVMTDCYASVQDKDVFRWLECLQSIQSRYLSPLNAGIKSGRCNSMRLIPVNGYAYQLQRKQLRRWWQRRRSLETFLTT